MREDDRGSDGQSRRADEVRPATKEAERAEAEARSSPSGTIVYKAILKEGEEELERTSSALFWSGVAAGLAMGFSMFAQAFMIAHLPDAEWRPLVSALGYPMGYLMVILGRQQLFTENTLTPVLPLLQNKPNATIPNVLRLWGIVLVANLIGAVAISLVAAHTNAFDPEVREAIAGLGEHAMSLDFGTVILRGIFAGWLIALIVWLLPFAESARLWVIVIVTYIVGIGGFTHVIAGSIDVYTYAAMGKTSWVDAFVHYTVPAFIGNVIGGLALVTALNHGQVAAGKEDVG